MMDERNFKKLIVWQKAMEFVDGVYELQRTFPKVEIYALGDQIRRAVVAIPSNIAEGYGRGSKKDYAHFLAIARGSVYETITQLNIAKRQHFAEDISSLEELAYEISRMLNTIIMRLNPSPSTLAPQP